MAADTPRKGSKREKAMNIYRKWAGQLARKDVIAKLITQADLTEAGAATYYQNFKSEGVKFERHHVASTKKRTPAKRKEAEEATA